MKSNNMRPAALLSLVMNPSVPRRALYLVALALVACGSESESPVSPSTPSSPPPLAEESDAGVDPPLPAPGVDPPLPVASEAVPLAEAFVRISTAECTSELDWVGGSIRARLGAGKYQFSSCTLQVTPAAHVGDVVVSLRAAPAAPTDDPWTVTQKRAGDKIEISFARKYETFERTSLALRLDFSREGRKEYALLELEPALPRELARFEAPRIATTLKSSETVGDVTMRVRRPARVDADGNVVLRLGELQYGEGLVVEMPYELMPGVRASVVSTMWDVSVSPAVPFEDCLFGKLRQPAHGLKLDSRTWSGDEKTGADVFQVKATDYSKCNRIVGRQLVMATLYAELRGFGYDTPLTGDVRVRVVSSELADDIELRRVDGGVALKNVADHTLVGLRAQAPCDGGAVTIGERPVPRLVGDLREHLALEPGGEVVWTAAEIRAAPRDSCAGDVAHIAVREGETGQTGWVELESLPSR